MRVARFQINEPAVLDPEVPVVLSAGHGRVRNEHWGDRTLDLDLIDLGGRVISDERLELPHPRAWERAFVLRPWLDLEPDAVMPGRGAVAELRLAASDEVVRR